MHSELNNWIFSNNHQTEFSLNDCRYRPVKYRNYGFSPGWRFDDTLQYDWQNGVARYQGNLQRPGETEATYQELEHSLSDPETTDNTSISSLNSSSLVVTLVSRTTNRRSD